LFTLKGIPQGVYVMEYVGEELSYEEACERESENSNPTNSYMYFFGVRDKLTDKLVTRCVDATNR
jgi:SET domain-containing protein